MTAPSAPTIKVRQDGTSIYVRWQPVLNATDYTLYLKDEGGVFGVEDSIPDDDLYSDGWFFTVTRPQAGVVYVKLTALNALAEESAASNIVQVNLRGPGTSGFKVPVAIRS